MWQQIPVPVAKISARGVSTPLIAFICFAICQGVASAGPKEDLISADKAFASLAKKVGPHAAFLATMTDDALLYEGDHPPIKGKKAAATYYAEVEKAKPETKFEHLDWWPVSADASSDGEFGSTQGRWRLSARKKDGSPLALKGYYVTEWHKQKDGAYKFSLDIGGAD
ncbi:MAG: hypothetical protein JOZ55_12145 [Alphaproteobacteria bacterium]|nr:hypothetical protein [Alphaproteobacteria bacterium]